MQAPDWIAFDLEDDSVELLARGESGLHRRVVQIAAVDSNGKAYWSPGNVPEFLAWLQDRRGARVWAHNVGYDLGLLFSEKMQDLDVIFPERGSRVIKAHWEGMTFCDTFNLVPLPLAEIGESLGVRKLPFDPSARDYCERDVEILAALLRRVYAFGASNGVKIGATAGGLAVALFEAWGGKFIPDPFFLGREAIFGGRVEMFTGGASGLCSYQDVNSLYPAMLCGDFPLDPATIRHDLDCRFGFAAARVKVPSSWLPVLPVRREDSTVFFPHGKFIGIWNVEEIREAEKNGATVEKVFCCYGTNSAAQPYGDYCRRLYDLKSSAENPADRLLFKILVNSFAGQLGSAGVCARTVAQDSAAEYAGPSFAGRRIGRIEFPVPKQVNFLHAGIVTARARIFLHRAMMGLGHSRMIYCDTDAVIYRGAPALGDSPDLGAWRLEGTAAEVICRAPKVYRFGDKYVAKGVRRSAAREFVLTGAAEFSLPYSFRESVHFYERGNIKRWSSWRSVMKKARGHYGKKMLRGGKWMPRRLISENYFPKMGLQPGAISSVFEGAENLTDSPQNTKNQHQEQKS